MTMHSTPARNRLPPEAVNTKVKKSFHLSLDLRETPDFNILPIRRSGERELCNNEISANTLEKTCLDATRGAQGAQAVGPCRSFYKLAIPDRQHPTAVDRS
jgi:hypothetical protein